MTEAEAKALREKWRQLVDPLDCRHLYLELESSEAGYLTGHYHCSHCGHHVHKDESDSPTPGDLLPC